MKLLSAFSTIAQTILLSVFLYSSTLWAFPFGSGLCPKSNPLLDLINYVGKDQREYLDVGGPKLGLSAEEMDQIRKTTGRLSCTLSNGDIVNASASLAGAGDEIITAGHTFTNKLNNRLSDCVFTNFDTPPATSKLVISGSHEGLLLGHDFPKDIRNDFAVAKLVTPIKSAKPFPIDLSDTPITNHQKTILISAQQDKMTIAKRSQPIVEECGMEDQDFYGVSTLNYNDCTAMAGASGGAQLKRSSTGHLVLKGIAIQEGFAKKPGEYNKNNGTFQLTLAIGTRLLSDFRKFDPSIQIDAGGVDDSR